MPRPLDQQVVVITGASSGIGRASSVEFGKRGASVVLAARNEPALNDVANDVRSAGGQAHVVVTDVSEPDQVDHLADEAIRHFGRIDTWVNNAGFGHAGTIEQMEPAEMEQLLKVNVLGTMYGTRAALSRMRPNRAGTIINLGSVVSIRGIPLQSVYCSSKHAVKGFTEAVRAEEMHAKSGIELTLIYPAVIDTPFYDHARSKTGKKLTAFEPIYPPSAVAESIVFAAEHPRRDIFVGGMGKVMDVLQRINPKIMDWQMSRQGGPMEALQAAGPQEPGKDNMFGPAQDRGPIHGGYQDRAKSTSLYTKTFEWHPALKGVALGVAALGAAALIRKLVADPHPHARVAKEYAQVVDKKAKAVAKRWS